MLVVIDIGNTNITIGIYHGDKLIGNYRLTTKMKRTSDEYGFMVMNFLNASKVQPADIKDVIVSSVVPKIMHSFLNGIRKYMHKEPILVGPGIKTGLNIRIDNPAQLGADLVAGAVAAVAKYPLPCIIFDLGTATTISVIDEKGYFLGGTICAGVTITLEALANKTALLPHINIEKPKTVIGTNTIHSMQSGAIYGTAAMIDGIADRIEEELGQPATLIATGGLADIIIPVCKRKLELSEHLLLDGLRIIYQKNKVHTKNTK